MNDRPTGALPEQVRAATRDLQKLQGDLRHALQENALDLRNVLDHETLQEFSTALDDVRCLTWPQVLALDTPEDEENAQAALQVHRMRRIRSMLAALQAEGVDEFQPRMRVLLAEVEQLLSQTSCIC